MKVITTVRRTIRRYDLAGAGTRVVVALSGGADSVALAYLLRELEAAGELTVAGLAHFNHQLRVESSGPSGMCGADRDERFCISLAETIGLSLLVEREDVRLRAEHERRSTEDAAHEARHEFFDRACAYFAADAVAVGHTRDDQAETFLLRLLRGAGPKGLAGMHPRNGRIIRPLIECRRADLRTHLAERGVQYVEDETNCDVRIPRNRVRVELLPLLQSRFNPNIVDVLADEAELARADWLWMDDQLAMNQLELASDNLEHGTMEPGTWSLEVSALERAPLALRRLALWKAMTLAAGGRPVSFRHVEAAMRLVESPGTDEIAAGGRPARGSPAGGRLDEPGHSVERVGPRLVLTKRAAPKPANLFRYRLPVPGEVTVSEAGWIVSAEPAAWAGADVFRATAGNRAAVVRRDAWTGPLAVRNRRPGDRFRPLGLDGRKKLQDFFVDRKVARHERDGVPLVVDEADRIVWVAGHGIDEAFRVTDASQPVVILKLRPA